MLFGPRSVVGGGIVKAAVLDGLKLEDLLASEGLERPLGGREDGVEG